MNRAAVSNSLAVRCGRQALTHEVALSIRNPMHCMTPYGTTGKRQATNPAVRIWGRIAENEQSGMCYGTLLCWNRIWKKFLQGIKFQKWMRGPTKPNICFSNAIQANARSMRHQLPGWGICTHLPQPTQTVIFSLSANPAHTRQRLGVSPLSRARGTPNGGCKTPISLTYLS